MAPEPRRSLGGRDPIRAAARLLGLTGDRYGPTQSTTLQYAVLATARTVTIAALLICCSAYAEWRIATRIAPPGSIQGVAVGLALAVPAAAVALQVLVSAIVLADMYLRSSDELPRLASAARQIAAGKPVEVPSRLRGPGAADMARVLRQWQETATIREALLRGAPVGICLLDRQGIIVETNPALRAMLGYAEAELEGRRLLELIHPDDVHLAMGLAPEVLAREGLARGTVEARNLRRDGTWLWCAGVLEPLGQVKRQPDGYVVILEDISERRRETERAAQVQRDMLPQAPPVLEGWDLAGACRAARDVAGDLFDWVDTGDGHLDLTLADVMGKGLGSALVMATLRTALRMAATDLGPAARLERVAESMVFGTKAEGLFVKLAHCRLDLASGRLRYVDAGLGCCLVRRAGGTVERLSERSLPLGLGVGERFLEGEVWLGPGDVLLVCSDTLVELAEASGRVEALAADLEGARDAEEMVERLLGRGPEGRQADDLTVLVLRRLTGRPAPVERPPAAAAPPPAAAEPGSDTGRPRAGGEADGPATPVADGGHSRSQTVWQVLATPSLVVGVVGLLVTAGLVVYAEWWLGTGLAGARPDAGTVVLGIAGPLAVGLPWAVLIALSIFQDVRFGLSPLPVLATKAREIAAGDRVAIPFEDRSDLVGDLARALREWRDTIALREVLLQSAPVGICLLDGRWLVRHANRALLSTLASTRERIEGHHLLDLVHPEDRQLVGRMTTGTHVAGVDRAVEEARMERGDGSWVWCEVVVATVRQLEGFVVILSDIDDRRHEAERAGEVQREMLPRTPPVLDGWDVAGACRPATDVGGDLFDWAVPRPGHLEVTLGDVMGHGMASGLVMAALRTALRMAPAELGPAAQVDRLASSMTFGSPVEGLFVTLFHAHLELATGRLRYVDAGHGYCLVRRAGGEITRLPVRSLPLGAWAGEAFREGEVRLEPGDVLLLCSDGLVEVGDRPVHLEDLAGDLDGDCRADEMVRRLLARVAEDEQADDVTVLVLRRQPATRRTVGHAVREELVAGG